MNNGSKAGTVVTSMNFFVKSLWLRNVPVVQQSGRWLQDIYFSPIKSCFQYLISRLSPLFSFANSFDDESIHCLQRAQCYADDLVDMDECQRCDLNATSYLLFFAKVTLNSFSNHCK